MKLRLLLLLFTLMFPQLLQAAGGSVMSLDATTYTVEQGKTFDVIVNIDPKGEALDTVRAVVTFDPAILQVQNVSLSGAFDRVAPGNYWDNVAGKLSWGAFTLEGPTTTVGSLATVTFLPLAQGEAKVSISSDSRAISDGVEKIDLSALGTAQVTVAAAQESQPGTALIVVQSSTHANDVDWYTSQDVAFTWTTLEGDSPITAYYVALDERSDTDPILYLAPSTTEFSREGVSDGAHYFHIKGVQADGRQTQTVHRRVNIDATAPHPIELVAQDRKILEGESAWLTFATIDDTSGVAQYQVAINDEPYQVRASPLEAKDLPPGTYFIRVAAFDRAGNATYGSTSVRVYPKGTDLQRPAGYGDEKAGADLSLLITFLLGGVLILCIIYAFIKRKHKS